MTADLEPLWRWVREREEVRRRKDQGGPPPWTTDRILSSYRFCCVRREDDRVTRWIRDHVRVPYAGHPDLWFMLAICRQVNWPDTLAELIGEGAWPDRGDFSLGQVARVLRARRARGDKVYTGAYTISAPAERGADKQAYVAEVILGGLYRSRGDFFDGRGWGVDTMERTHRMVSAHRGWGVFMSYQLVVDLRFCDGVLGGAPDRESWAAAGPGTVRGLNRLHGRPTGAALGQEQALKEMRAIYERVERETGVRVDLSDVPNILCETDKYLRVLHGEGEPRARYVPGRGW